MDSTMKDLYRRTLAWVACDAHRTRARELKQELNRAFTQHPEEAGESYFEHLCFTTGMSLRFLYTTVVIMVHGLFPFLMTKTASNQIEAIYRIMKTRIPKSRRDAIDAADDYII